MSQTPNHDYDVPQRGTANWHEPLNRNFERFEVDIEIRDSRGNLSDYQPTAGAKFLATDTGEVYEGDGSNWNAKLAQYRYSAASSSSVAGNLVAGHASNSVDSGVGAATISGGGTSTDPNEVTGASSTVGGGTGNRVTSNRAVIAGGDGNEASGEYATIAGGDTNDASGEHATVAGGQANSATGQHATVAGGQGNSATAPGAFAAGTNASADHEGAFVYSDTSSGGLSSLNPNEFSVSAAGGVFLFSNESATTGVELTSGSGSWSSASSRALKSNVDPVDPVDILDRVADLDVSTWNYDAEGAGVRHMGPMAEDFAAAFGLGSDDSRISNVDADGVALAAIKGLSEELDERDTQIEEQQRTIDGQQECIDELEAENAALRRRVEAIEEQIDGLSPDAIGPVTADD